MKRILSVAAVGAMLLVVGVQPASAGAITFLGVDPGVGEGTRLASFPNSDAARANFFSNLVGVGTENFEGVFTGTADFGGGLTATLSGGFVESVPVGTNGFGRYPTSGTQYWDNSGLSMTLSFSAPVAAFGFYGIDIGDFNGQVTLTTVSGTPLMLNIGNPINVTGGGVLYFGFYVTDPGEQFTSISFGNTSGGVDVFGFDDFSIGRLEQVVPSAVPEPGTWLLLGSGLVLGAARLRRRRA